MSSRRELKIRDIDFRFTDDIPTFHNPENVAWSIFCNSLGSMAIHFERYVMHGARKALAEITDETLLSEAKLFVKQEGVHSRKHRAHLKWLINRHPEVAAADEDVAEYYAPLYNKSFEFQLAYAANVEGLMGPAMNFIIDNRKALYGNGDTRIASFILWHFVEELEHRNSALDIYNHVVGNYFYRVATMTYIAWHFGKAIAKAARPFSEIEERETGKRTPLLDAVKQVSWRSKGLLLFRFFCVALPFHNPEHLPTPRWAQRWFEDEEAGADMRVYYSG